MKNLLKWIMPVLLVLFVVSCKKGGTTDVPPVVVPDTTKPTISIVDPTANKIITLGTAMHLQMDLSDNVELKSYKVTIAKSLKGVTTSDWAYSNTWAIPAGKKALAVNHNEILVPLTFTGNQVTLGNYDVLITCEDLAGNSATATSVVVFSK
ncbi:MAG: DUF4625 domain-containing protein [Prolixibacteraceae bacterium]|jgi:hypothetical protein|nr:DUF4625 domain-containing protein [Prolixibacteraceae bacterium]